MSDLDAMEYNNRTHNGAVDNEETDEEDTEVGVGDEELWDQIK